MRLGCVPADGRSDELVCRMAARLFGERGMDVDVLPAAAMTAERVERVTRLQVDAVIASAVGPPGRLPAWHFYKRMRQADGDLLILIGAWGAEGRANVLGSRFREDDNVRAVATFREAAAWIDQRSPEILLRRNAASAS
jgi:hypothetical protein